MSSETRHGSSPGPPAASQSVDRHVARYLVAVSDLSEPGDDRVSTGDVRTRLDVAPASVTEMFARLAERGLVDYETYRGAALTPRGETVAADLAWRVCVVSTYFEAELGAPLDEETALDVAVTLPRDGLYTLRELGGGPCLDRCPESGADGGECASC